MHRYPVYSDALKAVNLVVLKKITNRQLVNQANLRAVMKNYKKMAEAKKMIKKNMTKNY